MDDTGASFGRSKLESGRVPRDKSAAGFILKSESIVLRRSEGGHFKLMFDSARRRKFDCSGLNSDIILRHLELVANYAS